MSVAAAQTGADALAVLLEEARTAVVLPWQPRTPTSVAVAQTGADKLAALLEEARTTVAHAHERGGSPDGRGRAGGAPGGGAHGNGGGRVDGERDLHRQRFSPRIGTVVTTGSRLLSWTSAPAVGGLPSLRPTTSNGLR